MLIVLVTRGTADWLSTISRMKDWSIFTMSAGSMRSLDKEE